MTLAFLGALVAAVTIAGVALLVGPGPDAPAGTTPPAAPPRVAHTSRAMRATLGVALGLGAFGAAGLSLLFVAPALAIEARAGTGLVVGLVVGMLAARRPRS